MRTLLRDVVEFHHKFGIPIIDRPAVPSDERVCVRRHLIEQEFNKLMSAIEDDSLENILQETVELMYVLVGGILEYGMESGLLPAWAAVHEANMRKDRGEEGDIIEPADWQPADFAGILKIASALR